MTLARFAVAPRRISAPGLSVESAGCEGAAFPCVPLGRIFSPGNNRLSTVAHSFERPSLLPARGALICMGGRARE